MDRLRLTGIGAVTGAAFVLLANILGVAPLVSGAKASSSSTKASSSSESAEAYRQLELFGKVYDLVRRYYIDRPEDTKLIGSALNGMLSGLDPHSSYMDPDSFRDMQTETSGQFGGVGVTVSMQNGFVTVDSTQNGTPAAKADIRAGDIIIKIDRQPVAGLSFEQIVTKLRGPPESSVVVEIARPNEGQPLEKTLVREIITARSVYYRIEGDDVGYVQLIEFNGLASDELKEAIKHISSNVPTNRLKGYILDLRNDPGGLLDQAVAVSDAFLNDGQEIVSTRGRYDDDDQRYNAKSGDLTHGKPLIVLINGATASAAEIVSGALQDHKRATIVGTRSFGKGSVQTIIPMGQGNGALRLTTARYYTPSGRSIQARGITPDIRVSEPVPKDLSSEDLTVSEAALRGHLKASGPEEKGSQTYVPVDPKDDKALQTALDLLRGSKTNPAFPPRRQVVAK